MMSRPTAALMLVALSLLPACGRRGSPLAEGGGASSEVEIVGPATLRIDGRLIRLAGISVPRAAPEAACWAEALLSREAMEVLDAETNFVRDMEIQPLEDVPGGARVLVHGRDLSRIMVDKGLAAQTSEGWDWCGALDLNAPKAPRLGYTVAPGGTVLEEDESASPPQPAEQEQEP